MTRVTVVEIHGCMASSAAITHDVMATANRIGAAAKRACRLMSIRYAAVQAEAA